MKEEEISELYVHYESVINMLLAKCLIDKDLATTHKEKFYDTLDEKIANTQRLGTIVKQYAYI